MSQIKGRNTRPEMVVRKFLFSKGFGYRLNVKNLPGKPDVVLSKYHTVIFVNGCFWHGHAGCRYYVVPKTRTQWWLNKIDRNRELDIKNTKLLHQDSWKVITIFECELKSLKRDKTLNKLYQTLKRISVNE